MIDGNRIWYTLKRWIRAVGFDVERFRPSRAPGYCLGRILQTSNIELVLDVGANRGQYVSQIRRNGYSGRIISFEPGLSAHKELTRRAASDPAWKVAPRVAVADFEGTSSLNVTRDSVSSSLDMFVSGGSEKTVPSTVVRQEKTRVTTLDRIVKEFCAPDLRVFIKLDVQGAERRILQASNTLDQFNGLQVEVSLGELYSSGATFEWALSRIAESNFDVVRIIPGHTDVSTGEMLQCDIVAVRDWR